MTDTVRLAAALLGKAKDADAWADSYKGQRLEAWMRDFASVARLAATVLEKCPKVVGLGDDAALSAPPAADMREALARQVANAKPGHDSLGSFGPDGLVVYLSPEQRGLIVAGLSAPQVGEQLERVKNAIDFQLNEYLCDMKEGYDDSIVGFNEAWGVVRKVLAERLAATPPPPTQKASS